MITLEVTCPEGVVEGDLLAVERPSDGASFEVPLPAGVESGGAFLVELPEEAPPAEPSGAAVPAPSGLAARRVALRLCRIALLRRLPFSLLFQIPSRLQEFAQDPLAIGGECTQPDQQPGRQAGRWARARSAPALPPPTPASSAGAPASRTSRH